MMISDQNVPRIVATDIDRAAVRSARLNAEKAGVDKLIHFDQCHFKDTRFDPGSGVVILNPEYGERLGKIDQLKITYGEIGDFFKKRCQGMTGYIFTGNPALAKSIGLRTRKKIPFMNGDIECRLLEFELYAGSHKDKTRDP
jgi:putative N6-adenine-specific DNA methylase